MLHRLGYVLFWICFVIAAILAVGTVTIALMSTQPEMALLLAVPSAILYSIGCGLRYIFAGDEIDSGSWWKLSPSKKIKKKKKGEIEPLNAFQLAGIPIMKFIEKEYPFDESPIEDIHIDDEYEPTVRVSMVGYQFFTYLMLITNRFGAEVSELVRKNIVVTLNRSEQMGDQLDHYISCINESVQNHCSKGSLEIDTNDGKVELPLEASVAMHMSYSMPSSPLYVDINKEGAKEEFMERSDMSTVLDFAVCLEHAKEKVIDAYRDFIEKIDLDEDSFYGIRVKNQA